MLTNKNYTKIAAAAIATVMLAGSVAGCSGGNNSSSSASGSNSSSKAASGEPYNISVLAQYFATEVPKSDAKALKMIEEYTNTKLDITWKPSAGFDENLNILIASDNLPMVTTVRDNKAPVVTQAVQGGIFWEIKKDYLSKFNNLSKINYDVANNVSYDGKLYSLYRWSELSRSGWHYRKDWADKLGLKEPTTIDELYNMIHQFTVGDPDGNGKNDTFGLGMAADIAVKLQFHSMVIAFGGGNEWVADGKGGVEPTFMTQPYIDAMNFFKKIYAEKAMNQDYPSASKNNVYEYFNSGKAGVIYFSLNDAVGSGLADLKKANPSAVNDIFSRIKSPDGSYRCYPTPGWKRMFMMSKKSVKTEADLMKILTFFDKMDDKEMQELTTFGIEGEHYDVTADGKIQLKNRDDFQNNYSDFSQLGLLYTDNTRPVAYTPLQQKVKDMINENTPYAVPNVVNPFSSETEAQMGTTLDQIIADARDKYIIGAINLDQFNKEVEKWKSQGGSKIIDEYTAKYKAVGGK